MFLTTVPVDGEETPVFICCLLKVILAFRRSLPMAGREESLSAQTEVSTTPADFTGNLVCLPDGLVCLSDDLVCLPDGSI